MIFVFMCICFCFFHSCFKSILVIVKFFFSESFLRWCWFHSLFSVCVCVSRFEFFHSSSSDRTVCLCSPMLKHSKHFGPIMSLKTSAYSISISPCPSPALWIVFSVLFYIYGKRDRCAIFKIFFFFERMKKTEVALIWSVIDRVLCVSNAIYCRCCRWQSKHKYLE